jgi:hypothetical protein
MASRRPAMGVSAIDYDCDGNLDIVKTNFAGDTTSLYRNLGQDGLRRSNLSGGTRQEYALPRFS